MKLTYNVVDKILNSRGRFISATFRKQNGDERTMNFVVPSSSKPNKTGFLTVKEVRGGFRKVNLQTLSRVVINGKEYTA